MGDNHPTITESVGGGGRQKPATSGAEHCLVKPTRISVTIQHTKSQSYSPCHRRITNTHLQQTQSLGRKPHSTQLGKAATDRGWRGVCQCQSPREEKNRGCPTSDQEVTGKRLEAGCESQLVMPLGSAVGVLEHSEGQQRRSLTRISRGIPPWCLTRFDEPIPRHPMMHRCKRHAKTVTPRG